MSLARIATDDELKPIDRLVMYMTEDRADARDLRQILRDYGFDIVIKPEGETNVER